jgi:hypothetical protein
MISRKMKTLYRVHTKRNDFEPFLAVGTVLSFEPVEEEPIRSTWIVFALFKWAAGSPYFVSRLHR